MAGGIALDLLGADHRVSIIRTSSKFRTNERHGKRVFILRLHPYSLEPAAASAAVPPPLSPFPLGITTKNARLGVNPRFTCGGYDHSRTALFFICVPRTSSSYDGIRPANPMDIPGIREIIAPLEKKGCVALGRGWMSTDVVRACVLRQGMSCP